MINVKNLTIAFENKVVIDDIDIYVPHTGSLVILGKNGCGKSVILKAIGGLIDEYTGTIEIKNTNIKSLFAVREDRHAEKLDDFRVAYVFQKGGLFDSMNVFDNIAFGLRRIGVDEDSLSDMVLQSLARVGLKGNENKLPSELSGGMQKRVGLARAICLKSNIILYDDPTAGLDPILSDSIADLILEIRNSIESTSIIVTHDLKVAEKVADTIALIYDGKVVFNDTSEQFFSNEDEYAKQFIEGEIEGPIDMY